MGGQHMTDISRAPLEATRPVISDEGSNEHMLAANDDGSTGPVQLGFPVNFFGTVFTSLYVNTNGSVTFREPLYTYQPTRLTGRTPPIIAPFLADVDTRPRASGRVRYGPTTFEGRAALGVNWLDVGYHEARTDRLNRFQLLLVDRGDLGFGDFDIVMNYDRLEWESGEAAGGHAGLGGLSASAGAALAPRFGADQLGDAPGRHHGENSEDFSRAQTAGRSGRRRWALSAGCRQAAGLAGCAGGDPGPPGYSGP